VNSFNPEIAIDKLGSPERYLVPAIAGVVHKTARHNPISIMQDSLEICWKSRILVSENICFVMCDTPKFDSLAYMFVVLIDI
jgi:hypothetical protein